jgi:hypothetical protein
MRKLPWGQWRHCPIEGVNRMSQEEASSVSVEYHLLFDVRLPIQITGMHPLLFNFFERVLKLVEKTFPVKFSILLDSFKKCLQDCIYFVFNFLVFGDLRVVWIVLVLKLCSL